MQRFLFKDPVLTSMHCVRWPSAAIILMLIILQISVALQNLFASPFSVVLHCFLSRFQEVYLVGNTLVRFLSIFFDRLCRILGKKKDVTSQDMAVHSRGRPHLAGSVREIRLRSSVFQLWNERKSALGFAGSTNSEFAEFLLHCPGR